MVTERRTNGNPTGYVPPKPVKVRLPAARHTPLLALKGTTSLGAAVHVHLRQKKKTEKAKKGKKAKMEKWTGPKMRPVFWEKMRDKAVKGTMWEESDPDMKFEVLQQMFPGLRDMFEVKEKKKKAEDPNKKKKKKKAEKVKILDGKRSQNCEIALSKFKIPFESLRDAVMNMDVSGGCRARARRGRRCVTARALVMPCTRAGRATARHGRNLYHADVDSVEGGGTACMRACWCHRWLPVLTPRCAPQADALAAYNGPLSGLGKPER